MFRGVDKRPLSACYIICKCSMETYRNSVKIEFGNKDKAMLYFNDWSMEGVTVYGHAPECHGAFGTGGLQNGLTRQNFLKDHFKGFRRGPDPV